MQTSDSRVTCNMSRDYSGAVCASGPALLRTLCALMTRRETSPPPSDQRPALLDRARVHRVERLVVRAVRERGEDLSAWFGDDAAGLDDERGPAVVDAIRTRELRSVIDALAAIDGAAPVVFKGAALAHSHYPAPWLRPRLDTDLLISPSHIAGAASALAALGYARAVTIPGALVLSQASFSRTDDVGVEHALDVHWKIANWHVIAAALSHDEIAGRAVPLPVLGPHARAAAGRDALVLACLHRAAHHRDSGELLWIYDIHLIAQRLSADDWTAAVAVARRAEVKALCARGLALAIEWFDAPVPPDVVRALDTRADAAAELSAVYLSSDQRLVDGLITDLRALPVRKRVQLLMQHLFPPPEYMRQRYQTRSRVSIALWYVRRMASGVPKWFVRRSGS
ncbi:MAG: nucleotidyltransferase family protein [Candidatus Dormibacteria bacterium]